MESSEQILAAPVGSYSSFIPAYRLKMEGIFLLSWFQAEVQWIARWVIEVTAEVTRIGSFLHQERMIVAGLQVDEFLKHFQFIFNFMFRISLKRVVIRLFQFYLFFFHESTYL